MRYRIRHLLAALLAVTAPFAIARAVNPAALAQSAETQLVDTALILAVDTSRSVNDERFRLQMNGIAAALEDKGVVDTILGGPRGAIAIQLTAWADASHELLAWTLIRSQADALSAAAKIRRLPRTGGEYTCMGRMLRSLTENVLPTVPYEPLKTVIDVSGDGIDNCESIEELDTARQGAVEIGAVINGLPVIIDKEQLVGEGAYRAPGAGLEPLTPPNMRPRMTLDQWFETHIIGGFGAFIIPAYGYEDFARAMRSKFVVEISLHDRAPDPHILSLATAAVGNSAQ